MGCHATTGEGKKIPFKTDYFAGAKKLKFVVSGKEITDQKTISHILEHLDLSDKRRTACQCDGLFTEVIFKDSKKVIIELTPHGWGFKEDRGNIRYLKDRAAFEKLYEKLWEKYGPETNVEGKQNQ